MVFSIAAALLISLNLSVATAQFENDLGAGFGYVPEPKKEIPVKFENDCDFKKISQIMHTESCMKHGVAQSCAFLGAQQANATAGLTVLSTALLGKYPNKATISDFMRLQEAYDQQVKHDLSVQRLMKLYVRERIRVELQLTKATMTGSVSRNGSKSEEDFLKRLIKENGELIEAIPMKPETERQRWTDGASPVSRSQIAPRVNAYTIDGLGKTIAIGNDSPEVLRLFQEGQKNGVFDFEKMDQNEKIQKSLGELSKKMAATDQRNFLSPTLIARQEQAGEVFDSQLQIVRNAADPGFETEIRKRQNAMIAAKKRLAELPADTKREVRIAAENDVSVSRILWQSRLDEHSRKIAGPSKEFMRLFPTKEPLLSGYLNFNGSAAQIESIMKHVDTELRKRGQSFSSYKEDLHGARYVGLAFASVLVFPTISISSTMKIHSCGEKFKMSRDETDLLLRANPKLGLLENCDQLRTTNLSNVLQTAWVEWGRIPNGLCELAKTNHKPLEKLAQTKVTSSTCQGFESADYQITERDGKKLFRCTSKSIPGLTYETSFNANNEPEFEAFKSHLNGKERPNPAERLRQSLRDPPTKFGREVIEIPANGERISPDSGHYVDRNHAAYNRFLNFCNTLNDAGKVNDFETCSCVNGALVAQAALKNMQRNPICSSSPNSAPIISAPIVDPQNSDR